MSWLFAFFHRWNIGLALACAVAFAIALATGLGLKSLAFLGAGVWWLLLSRYAGRRAREGQRHRELRAERLERERKGLAPPRG